MKRIKFFRVLACAGALCVVFSALADVSLTIERVRQRYPWNGLVDVDYTISGMPSTEESCDWTIEMTACATTNGQAVVIACSNFVQAAWCDLPVENGAHRVTWNAALDGAGLFASNCKMTATLVRRPVSPREADFMIVDVSQGHVSGAKYPIRYVRAPGASTSLFNTDRYKLDRLVLKRVKACTFRMGDCDTSTGTGGAVTATGTPSR